MAAQSSEEVPAQLDSSAPAPKVRMPVAPQGVDEWAREVEYMRSTLDYDGFWDWNIRTNKEFMSDRFWTMLGYDPETKSDDPQEWMQLLTEEQLAQTMATFKEAVRTKNKVPYSQKVCYRHANGVDKVWVLCRGKIVEWDGDEPVRMMGTHTDVTDLQVMMEKEREQKLEAIHSRQERMSVFGMCNHELRTPLHSVMAFSKLINTEELSHENAEFVKQIRSNAQHMLNVINEILDWSSLEASPGMQLYEIPYHPMELCQRAVNNVRFLAEASKLHVSVESQGRLHEILGDSQKVYQILLNGLSNAVKYTDEGSVTLRIKETKDTIEYSVEDTGRGLTPEEVQHLFREFQRASSSAGVTGTGLGLMVARSMARLMGGDLDIHSQKGKGTNFILTLPLKVSEPDTVRVYEEKQTQEAELTAAEAQKLMTKTSTIRVLLVDDVTTNLTVLRHMLKRCGVPVKNIAQAKNGQEALDKFDDHEICFTDISMPIMDGVELTSRLKAKPKPPYVVVCSGDSAAEVPKADRTLAKPFSLAAVEAALHAVATRSLA